MRVLLVEDDPDVAGFINRGLMEQTYAVDVVDNGEEALYMASENTYDALVLDVAIPAPDGLDICRTLRANGSTVPILMLTARGSVDEKIEGLDAGADDYLPKPFEFGELLARLRALLRRGGATVSAVLVSGEMEVDTRSRRVTMAGRTIPLTTKEYSVLEYLVRNAGRVVTREDIAEHVWNQDFDPFTNVIDVYINRLRRYIERVSSKKLIHTIRGAGYIFDTNPPASGAAQ